MSDLLLLPEQYPPQYGGVKVEALLDSEPETYWKAAMVACERASKRINKHFTEERQWQEVDRLLAAGKFAEHCYNLAIGVKPPELEAEDLDFLAQEREVDD